MDSRLCRGPGYPPRKANSANTLGIVEHADKGRSAQMEAPGSVFAFKVRTTARPWCASMKCAPVL